VWPNRGGNDKKFVLAVFDHLHENNLKIQISKIKFFEDELKMLGVSFFSARQKN
jgi:hypothetical protein